MSRAGPFGVGWPGCHVIAKLIFFAFNKHAEIPANSNQPGSCNQALNMTRRLGGVGGGGEMKIVKLKA